MKSFALLCFICLFAAVNCSCSDCGSPSSSVIENIFTPPPPSRSASLYGNVTEEISGTPAPGARVCLKNGEGLLLGEKTADENGRYLFPDLRAGYYAVAAAKEDRVSRETFILLEPAAQKRIDPVLEDTRFNRCYGSSGYEYARSIDRDGEGNYYVAGTTWPYYFLPDGEVESGYGQSDFWVLKLSPSGDVLWSKTYGGSAAERYGFYLRAVPEGGFIAAGTTDSTDHDIGNFYGDSDVMVFRAAADGKLLWSKNYGGSATDFARGVASLEDGYVITAATNSADCDLEALPPRGINDVWTFKIDKNGDLLWNTRHGGSGQNAWNYDSENADVLNIGVLRDGHIVVSGTADSTDGDLASNHGQNDIFLMKFNSGDGALMKVRCIGGTSDEEAVSVSAVSDGGCIVSGNSYSSENGDIPLSHGGRDGLAVKLDADLNIRWLRLYGGSGEESGGVSAEIPDGSGYVLGLNITGYSEQARPYDGDVSGEYYGGYQQLWLLRTDGSGNPVKSRVLGSHTGGNGIAAIYANRGGGYTVTATAATTGSADVPPGHGVYDWWIFRTDGDFNYGNSGAGRQTP